MSNADSTDQVNAPDGDRDSSVEPAPVKKKFVRPEISVPVDVLEATTYFQVTDSGTTN